MLNQSYTLLPCAEAIRQAEHLFQVHGHDGNVFVRPDTLFKLFRGGLVTKAGLEGALAPAMFDPTTLVLVASPREVVREWRLVVAHSEVIAASQYMLRGEISTSAGCPAEVRSFAEEVLRQVTWRPDPLFMLDVGESEGQLHVVELNSFSCSGLYDSDVGPVVKVASETARRVAGSAS